MQMIPDVSIGMKSTVKYLNLDVWAQNQSYYSYFLHVSAGEKG